jgi:alpha-1,3-mannosyltransferase
LIAAQGDLGDQCEVLTLNRLFHGGDGNSLPSEDSYKGIRIRRIGMVGVPRFFVPFLHPADFAGFDVVHVHGMDGLFERVVTLPRHPGQVRIATTHGGIFHTDFLRPLKRAYFTHRLNPLAHRYDALTATSPGDVEMFTPRPPQLHLLSGGVRKLGDFTAEGADLLYIGRLSTNKQIDRLVAAMAEPALRQSGAHLHIIGPDWDVTRAALQEQALALGVGDQVTLHGKVDDAALGAIAQRCGVFVSASRFEGFGLSMVEAMGVGLIPAVQANPSFVSLLSEAQLGETTDFGDLPAAAATIMRQRAVAASPEARAKAKQFAQRYTWDSHAAKLRAVYTDCLARVRGPATGMRPAA